MMIKKGLLAIGAFVLLFSSESCIKDGACKNKSLDSERATIQAYAVANGHNMTEHGTGVFYQITNPGSGQTATATSNVSVKYIGKLTNGTIFDDKSTTAVIVNLSEVIKGWQY